MPISNPRKKSIASIGSREGLCAALNMTQDELSAALAMPADQRYSAVDCAKPDGSHRPVFNPNYLIRKFQRRLNKRIFSNSHIISWPAYIYGSVPNQVSDEGEPQEKDYISCAANHCLAKSLLHLDIKNFFDNIHQEQVFYIFKNFFLFSEDVSTILADLCCYKNHLVQGALTSSYLATLCLYDVEGAVVNLLGRKGLVYTRLVDDITVSSKTVNYDFSYAQKLIENMLADKGLPLNMKKLRVERICSEPLTVHGLRISFKEPRLPSDEVKRIRSAVKSVETLAREANYRTSHAYRKDFNRCMGRVNKLKRVGHSQHTELLSRLIRVNPLPSKKDIERVTAIIARLQTDVAKKRDGFWYSKRFYVAHERINIIRRSFPKAAAELRAKLTELRPSYY